MTTFHEKLLICCTETKNPIEMINSLIIEYLFITIAKNTGFCTYHHKTGPKELLQSSFFLTTDQTENTENLLFNLDKTLAAVQLLVWEQY